MSRTAPSMGFSPPPDAPVAWLAAAERPVRPNSDLQVRLVSVFLVIGAAMLSFHILRPGDVNFTLSDAAYLMALALLVVRGKLERHPFGALTAVWLLGFTLMQSGALVGSLINGDALRWFNIFSQYLVAFVVMPIMLTSAPPRVARLCLLAFVLGVTASQAITLATSLFIGYETTWPLMGRDFITATGRIGAFSGNANTNGAMIAFALSMLAYAAFRRMIRPWHAAVCGGILALALLSTASFTGFSTAALGLALLALCVSPRWFVTAALPLAVLVGSYIALGLPLPGAFQQRVGEALVSGDIDAAGTYVGRMALLQEAWGMADRTVLVGLGADQFRMVSSHHAPVHVFPMLIFVEGGFIAFLGLLILVGVLAGRCMAAMRFDRFGGAVALSLLVEFCIFSLSAPHMYARLWLGPMFITLAAVYAQTERPPRRPVAVRPAPHTRRRRRRR